MTEEEYAEAQEQRRQAEAEDEQVAFNMAQEQAMAEHERERAEFEADALQGRADEHEDLAEHARVSDMVGRLAQLEALDALIKDERAKIRARLQQEADRVTAETGAAANFPVPGVGRAYVTAPPEHPAITDHASFASWCRAKLPEAVQFSDQVDAAQVLAMAESDPELAARLREAGAMRENAVFDMNLVAELAAELHRDGERLVDPDGEVVPLKMERASRPTLVVKIEPNTKRRLAAQIAAAQGDRLLGQVEVQP